jgi:uncharacterized membrane protein
MAELEAASRSSSVERTIMLTDAVVAIAMTLLVLPLVDAVPEVDLDNVGAFVQEHLSQFISFFVSFLVILLFWAAHQRLFRLVEEMTGSLRLLNGLWLLTVAFLPFPTALVGRGPTTSTTPIYIGTVLVLALTSTAMSFTVARVVANPAASSYLTRRTVVALGSDAVLLACTLIAMWSPDAALYGLLFIAVVRVVGDRWAERRDSAAAAT